MAVSRRTFIKETMMCGAATGLGTYTMNLFAQINAVTPVIASPEIDAFKKAQQKLLLKYGIRAKSKYINLSEPQLKAHVLEAGKGSPLVMLHGGGTTAANFAPLMGALQKEYRLCAPDRPGCGLTDRFNYRGVPFREHAVDFVSSVFDSLHLSKAPIVANSMGGYWALAFALAKPEKVSRVC